MAQYDKKYGMRYIKWTAKRVEESGYRKIAPLAAECYLTREPLPYALRTEGEHRTIAVGDKWGEALFDCAWFHFTGIVPEEAKGEKIALILDVSGEMLVVDSEGKAVRGLTTYASEFDTTLGMPGKVAYPFLDCAKGGETVDVWADSAYNDLFGRLPNGGTLVKAEIAIENPNMRALHYDLEVMIELAEHLPEDSVRRAALLSAVVRALRCLSEFNEAEAEAARAALAPELQRKAADIGFEISAVGHAHMDLAWLWPVRETVRKSGRTFATALRNMEKYPEYIFGASQPQQYEWVKMNYPELYPQIKERVAEGRWELQGGMWVEADINMAGAESLVRQTLYGKRFFKSEFGVDVDTLWLPDVFSYSPAIPQIMKLSGMKYFVNMRTVLLTYSDFPFNSFIWRGIDGSEVITHVMPEVTYNSSAAPRAILKSERNFKNKGESGNALIMFGIGDGGGGPGEEHIERLIREKNLSGLAPVTQRPAAEFFKRLEGERDGLPTWSGELFVDNFQGTYTSQARVKYHMRKLERMLHRVELISSARLLDGFKYPTEQIERLWKETLLYQFHDILPGSSITRVNDEMVERSIVMEQELDALTAGAENAGSWFNPHGFPVEHTFTRQNKPVKLTIPPLSAINGSAIEPATGMLTADDESLENDVVRLEFGKNGQISRLFDKRFNREVLTGNGNALNVYADPGDAWRVPIEAYDNCVGCFRPEMVDAYVEGARAVRVTMYRFGRSTLTQRVEISLNSPRVDFYNQCDWNENEKTLRAEFPTAISGGRFNTEIQFGHIERPTHRQLHHELGKYEVYAHRFADLSREDMGFSIFNDSKYGHGCDGQMMSITLLRAPCYPDPIADRAHHTFAYAIYPHAGNLRAGNVAREAALFNDPIVELPISPFASLAKIDHPDVMLASVKKAEDSNDLIFRAYECGGVEVEAALEIGYDADSTEFVDLLEGTIAPAEIIDGSIRLKLRPFEIVSVKVAQRGAGNV